MGGVTNPLWGDGLTSKLFDPKDYKKPVFADIRRYFEAWWNILQIEGVKFTYSSLNRAWEYAQIVSSLPIAWDGLKVLDLGTSASLFPIYSARVLHAPCRTVDQGWEEERIRLYEAAGLAFDNVDVGDMRKLDIETESVDVVTCFSVIEHIPDYQSAVDEMKRVCKKGGYIGLTTDFMPDVPDVEKSGITFNWQSLSKLIEAFGLPIIGESNWQNVDLTRKENLAVDGKYTFASLMLHNV